MNIPSCVMTCEHPQLKNDAIAAWNLGTREEQDEAISACIMYNLSRHEIHTQNRRRDDFKLWLNHFQKT